MRVSFWICSILFLAAGAASAQDWTEVKKQFTDQWSTQEAAKQSAAVRGLASQDSLEAVELLFKAAKFTEKKVRDLIRKKQRIQMEMKNILIP